MTRLERPRVLLSLQRALLGAITPQVRMVDACWNDVEIRIRIVADDAVEDLEELAQDVAAEVHGDFCPNQDVHVQVESVPRGIPVPDWNPGGWECARVFARSESID